MTMVDAPIPTSKKSILAKAEADAKKILDEALEEVEKIGPKAATDVEDVAADAGKVDPGLDPLVTEVEADAKEVGATISSLPKVDAAPVVSTPTTTSVST